MRFAAILLAAALAWALPQVAAAQTAQMAGGEKISTSGWCVLFIDGAPERDAACQMEIATVCNSESEECGSTGKIRYKDGRVSIYSVEQGLTFIDDAQATPKGNRCWEYAKGGDTFCISLLPTYDHLLPKPRTASAAPAGDGLTCLVLRNRRELSRKPCTRTIAQAQGCEEGCKRTQRFRWPDGDETVIANIEESFEINGIAVRDGGFRVNGSRWCFDNPVSGNTFCYVEG